MTTLSLKLPDHLAQQLKQEARARKSTARRLARECLEKALAGSSALPPIIHDAGLLPQPAPGESFYDAALPILKKAWARRGRRAPDLATNPKYMEGFGE